MFFCFSISKLLQYSETKMGNAVKATGNAFSGAGKFVIGDTKGAKQKFNNSGKNWAKTGKQIANTAGDVGKTIKHTTYSAANATAGIANKTAGAVTNNKSLKNKGNKQLKKAGKQIKQSGQHIVDAVGGKAEGYGEICIDVGTPYSMKIISVNTREIGAKSGALLCLAEFGMVLLQLEKSLKSWCNGKLRKAIQGMMDKITIAMRDFRFDNVKHDMARDAINTYWDRIWEPQNIGCKFEGDSICFALNNTVINELINYVNGLKGKHQIDIDLKIKMGFQFILDGITFNCELIIDFDAVNVFCKVHGISMFFNQSKCMLEDMIKTEIKKATKHIIRCYKCNVNVFGDGTCINANANISVKGNVTKY